MHPEYGGWFALRCVLIFKNYRLATNELIFRQPRDMLFGDVERIVDLLVKFNTNWRDWKYRNAIKPKCKYSEIQKEYFLTEPANRKELMKRWLIEFKNPTELSASYEHRHSLTNLIDENYRDKNFFI